MFCSQYGIFRTIYGICGRPAANQRQRENGRLFLFGVLFGRGLVAPHDLSAEEAEKIITRVRIEEGVTHIGKSFFSGLTNLKEVEIADRVTSIGKEAFSSCKSLEAIAIPDGVTRIENWTFVSCTNLSSVELPQNLQYIGYRAFAGCRSLESIDIPESVTDFNSGVFRSSGLKQAVLPPSIDEISAATFIGCHDMVSVYIPTSVKKISNWALTTMDSFRNVYYGGTAEQWAQIEIEDDNLALKDAVIYYNFTPTRCRRFWNGPSFWTSTMSRKVCGLVWMLSAGSSDEDAPNRFGIMRSDDGGKTFEEVARIEESECQAGLETLLPMYTYTDKKVREGKTYIYKICAIEENRVSAYSEKRRRRA